MNWLKSKSSPPNKTIKRHKKYTFNIDKQQLKKKKCQNISQIYNKSHGLILNWFVLISSSFLVQNSIPAFITFDGIVNSQTGFLSTFYNIPTNVYHVLDALVLDVHLYLSTLQLYIVIMINSVLNISKCIKVTSFQSEVNQHFQYETLWSDKQALWSVGINKFIYNNVMKSSTKKQLTITFRNNDRPRLKTEPNSRTRPHYQHHNSQSSYTNQEHIKINRDNLTLPTLYKFTTDHKFDDPERQSKLDDRKKSVEKYGQRQQQKLKQESQSDKILNQFLINYFKKKNKFALKARASKLKREQAYQPEFLKQVHKTKKQRSQDKAALATNSIDAYFNINNLIQ